MSATITPEELLRNIRKWLIMPSTDGIERTAWPELVAQIDTTLHESNDAATAMHNACVEKVKAMRDEWRREADSREEFQFANDRLKLAAQANAADWIITALQSLTLDQVEQEKQ